MQFSTTIYKYLILPELCVSFDEFYLCEMRLTVKNIHIWLRIKILSLTTEIWLL